MTPYERKIMKIFKRRETKIYQVGMNPEHLLELEVAGVDAANGH